jgi:hypothetical protein
MPTIFEYLGIVIRFYSNDHEPIHVHAIYGDCIVKVNFFINDGKIYRTTYVPVKGKFPEAKLKQLKKFVEIYKMKIVYRWEQYFIWKIKVTKQTITNPLKNENRYD